MLCTMDRKSASRNRKYYLRKSKKEKQKQRMKPEKQYIKRFNKYENRIINENRIIKKFLRIIYIRRYNCFLRWL